MSRENWVACSPCKGIDKYYCDNCTAVCCQENMKKHREIFYLNDNFSSNVNKAEKELMEKAKESIDNLKKIIIFIFLNITIIPTGVLIIVKFI